jgi:hypothetical protein
VPISKARAYIRSGTCSLNGEARAEIASEIVIGRARACAHAEHALARCIGGIPPKRPIGSASTKVSNPYQGPMTSLRRSEMVPCDENIAERNPPSTFKGDSHDYSR